MNRLSKLPDFAIIIQRLAQSGTGISQISEITGYDQSTLHRIYKEAVPIPKAWIACWYLIDMYVRILGTPLPWYGEHN